MASTSSSADSWGRLAYQLPTSVGILESVEMKQDRFVIGRAKDCDLRIGLKMISAHHCYLSKESNGKVFLYDTSTNGTFVNATRVSSGQREEVLDEDKLYLIRKKSSPQNDFHLVFKLVSDRTNNQGPSCSDVETQHRTKRLKTEPVTNILIKSEPISDLENSAANPDTTEPDLSSNMNDNEVSDVALKSTTHDNPIINSVVKSEPTSDVENNNEPDPPSTSDVFNHTQVNNVASDDANVKKENESNPESQEVDFDQKNSNKSDDSDSNSMADILKCSLCLEIFHDPVCLQPCLHCYCSGCYSEWMACSNVCPQCRTPVQLLAKNHMISSLTETFLKDNPHRRRSSGDIILVESKNKIAKNQLGSSTNSQLDQDSNSSQNSGYNYPFATIQQKICKECPGNLAAGPQPGSSTANQAAQLSCGPTQPHISCCCCFTIFPDRRLQQGVKPQTCELCTRAFCHMYWGCTKQDCNGCLNKFAELKFTNHNLSNLISENLVETRILTDYVQSKGNTIQDVIQECFRRLDSGVYELTVNLTSNSVLCYKCGLTNLRTLTYKYRSDIPKNDFPNSVTSRPDCYWGMNCRTQVHNVNHAQRYNHICNQTRF